MTIFRMSWVFIIVVAVLMWLAGRFSMRGRLQKSHAQLLDFQQQLLKAEQIQQDLRSQQQDQLQQLQQSLQQLTLSDGLLAELRQQYQLLEQRTQDNQQQIQQLLTRNAELATQLERDQMHHQERLILLEQARQQLKQEFEHLAGKIFEQRSQTFTQQSQQNLQHLLEPLRQQVQDFRGRLEGFNEQQIERQSKLSAQLSQLAQLNQQMSEDAHNLTRALKNDHKQQGNWGELMLETVLERSGLRKDHEYKREVSFKTDAGIRRPDVIIYLPEKRHLIVDAKVSLIAYSEYLQAEDDKQRQQSAKQLVRSMRQHLDELAQRDYQRLSEINSPDLVFMFVPIEPAFALAFETDQQLFHDAFAKHIVIVTPTTLLASLRTVAQLWRLEQQNTNAQAIVQRGERMLDKFLGFIDSLKEIGSYLDKAQQSQQQAMKRLATGSGSLVNQAQNLQRLGVPSKRSLSEVLTESKAIKPEENGQTHNLANIPAPE